MTGPTPGPAVALARARWWRRTAGAALVFVVLEVVLVLVGSDPDPLRLALLVATCAALLALLLDALGGGEPPWRVDVERPSLREGGDPRLARDVAVVEDHLAARDDDRALRDRLAVLAEQVLRQRHGVHRDDPAAEARLGPELTALLTGPPRRMRPAEIDHVLTLIEEL